MSRDKYILFVLDSISHINQQLPAEKQISQDLATVLVGPNSELDSLSLINLIIEVEERINASLGKRIPILDKGIMSEEHGSFNTVSELIEWVIKEA
jgi:acyl carrier protein